MNQLLKQSTAATVVAGPVLDTDGAIYTGMVAADFNLTKNGTNAALSGNTITSLGNGLYTVALTTGNTDTLGRLDLSCNKSAYVMPLRSFTVLTSATFDAIVTNGANAANGLITAGTGTGQIDLETGRVKPADSSLDPATPTADFAAQFIADMTDSTKAEVRAAILNVLTYLNTSGGSGSGSVSDIN